jgi:ATP-dependent DNA helicase PIF1
MTQDEALTLLKTGRNVFLTGPAGSGKTHTLNLYIKYLEEHKVPVAVTASTGIAATHMNGQTVHSWSGIGLKKSFTKKDKYRLLNNEKLRNRVRHAKVLIIDEISMLETRVLDLVDEACRLLRDNGRPFGGLQVVFCGDFFQLPPVHKSGDPKPLFAYLSTAWQKADPVVCYLEKQYRQQDTRFLDVLNTIRAGSAGDDIGAVLRERYLQDVEGYSKPTRLRTHNADADAINSFELQRIDAPEHKYQMVSSGDPDLVAELKKACLAPEELVLKKGAVVMFVKNNVDKGYVNGTVGTVVDFDKETDYPIVETKDGQMIAEPDEWSIEDDDEQVLAAIVQVPLRLAWAITVHKSQGMSLDCAEIDLSKAFIEGMGYVALSRVRTLSGIKLVGLNKLALKVNSEIIESDIEFRLASEQERKGLNETGKVKLFTLHKLFLLR